MSQVIAGLAGAAYILPAATTRASWGTVNAATGCHEGAAPAGLLPLDCIRDPELTLTDKDGDGSTRKTPVMLAVLTQTEWSASLEIPWNPTDPQFILLRNAKMLRKPVAIAFLDGPKEVAGSQGGWADWGIFEFVRSEPQDKEMSVKITLKPVQSAVIPEWVQVTGGGT